MDTALSELPERLQKLELILNAVSDDAVSGAFSMMFEANDEVDPGMFEEVFAGQDMDIGPRGAAILACRFLLEETDREREILGEKYRAFEMGEVPDPDLRPIFRCALHLAKVGAAAAGVIGSHGLALAYHVGKAVRTGLTGWQRSQCIETWHEIRDHG